MPKLYRMSADTSEKEKVIGGLLTAAQGGWLALGGGIIAVGLLSLSTIIPPLAALVISAPIGLAVGGAFAFFKKEELTLFQYLTLKHRYKDKQKVLVNTMTYQQTTNDSKGGNAG